MNVDPYRRLLAIPGVRGLLLFGLVARTPVIATGLALTLHVVNGMGLGFLEAGLVGAASTGGTAVGAPVLGWFVDRHGLRPVVAVTTVAQLVFWTSAAFLPYWALLGAAFVAGVLALPVFSVVRQCLAAAVPPEQRRTGYALDSMLVEISYMTGPALAVAATTTLGSGWTMALIGVCMVGCGVTLLILNPATRTQAEAEEAGPAVPRRQWLTPALLSLLGVTLAATFVLAGTELSLIAVLKAAGAAKWTGLVLSLWSLSSLVGGFVYGALPRSVSPLVMVAGMGVLTVPVGLVGQWQLLALVLIPSGLLTAPALSTTIDTLSRWVPTGNRGEAMGLHGTALTLGLAVSSPITGFLIDSSGTTWAFAITGAIGAAIVLVAVPFWRRTPARPDQVARAAAEAAA